MKADAPCTVCGKPHPLLARALGVCPDCIGSDAGQACARAVHARSRDRFGYPAAPPRAKSGATCRLCGSACVIGEGERGYCGLRTVREGRLRHLGGVPGRGVLQWYRDPLPTNCVAAWVCGGSAQRGMHNLAVFYQSCTLDCLFCQNWHFREADLERGAGLTAEALARTAREDTYCVCYFGGDPASQMPHALVASRRLAARGVTVCWETAGTSDPDLLDRAVDLSLRSGGCVKFDLKAYREELHVALTGRDNRRTLANFTRVANRTRERPDPPLLVASTLLVPGYVDAEEVGRIARFIAEQDPDIPYALLGFAPHFLMPDLPRTSVGHAEAARQAARDAGLTRVRVGNRLLLGSGY